MGGVKYGEVHKYREEASGTLVAVKVIGCLLRASLRLLHSDL